ncbi:hypothetical protein WUBG_04315 [Wuchereria bancrofti]|uniref:Uncharacterized protein n=1 Tax=Wuchereria bancrofti TaxID=6293 RepID=J9F5I8_WUCBA|nr:hypothetical protein WUBG_04315 [Wuchereria bancrofti]VDM08303.1 unnamed protein product [Wuchereria bancrofti]
MKLSVTLLVVLITDCIAWPKNIDRTDNDLPIEQLSRIYQAILLKSKRSPSMGLSLAEYMASPQSQDNFHFIPIIRR